MKYFSDSLHLHTNTKYSLFRETATRNNFHEILTEKYERRKADG